MSLAPPIISSAATCPENKSSNNNAIPSSLMAPPAKLRLQGAEIYYGLVGTAEDAILLVETWRRGMLPHVPRRLGDRDRAPIRSRSIFVFVARASLRAGRMEKFRVLAGLPEIFYILTIGATGGPNPGNSISAFWRNQSCFYLTVRALLRAWSLTGQNQRPECSWKKTSW